MRRHVSTTKRSVRLRVALLAIVALLFQQVAFAANACSLTAMPATDMAMNARCSTMPTTARATARGPDVQHCALHCAHPTVVTSNAQTPNVPPLLLPAVVPVQPAVVALPVARAAHARDAANRTPGLPPPLRHRVLLI